LIAKFLVLAIVRSTLAAQSKQTARQLRTQYVDGICSNSTTLKSTLRVTCGH